MSRLLILLFLYFNYVFCVSYTDYSSSSSSEEITEPGSNRSKECTLDVDRHDSPLVITQRSSSLLHPNRKTRLVHIKHGRIIDFACPGDGNSLIVNGTDLRRKSITATCDAEGPRNKTYSWRTVVCRRTGSAKPFYRRQTCASHQGTVLDVSFELQYRPKSPKTRRVRVYAICFNEKLMIPYYTYNKIRVPLEMPRFEDLMHLKKDRGFHVGFHVDTLQAVYKRRTQRTCINAQLGFNRTSKHYIQDDNRHLLVPGFLTPPQDFSHPALRESTYRFLNAAPLWKGLYNWDEVENNIIHYLSEHGVKLETWTGVYSNVLQYNHTNATEPLYLCIKQNVKLMPIPDFFWKILYHAKRFRAVVFIVINNPYEVPEKICTDVSESTGWLSFSYREAPDLGYAYTCSYQEFKLRVPFAPNITVKRLLNKFGN